MGLLGWFFGQGSHNEMAAIDHSDPGDFSIESSGGGCAINPASGLPMINDDCTGIDVEGNPFGTDFSDITCAIDDISSCSLDDDWSGSTSGGDDWSGSSDDY